MNKVNFEGAWTALITPFRPDGQVDWDGLARLVDFQVREGINGLVPTGTTGESPTLDWAEHEKVIEQVVQRSQGKCPVLAGTGSNSTREALEATRHVQRLGAQGALLVDCYYNGPSSKELREQYYATVAAACPNLALVPYVIPGRTGTALLPEDLAILSKTHPNVAAVKEATGDLDRMARTRTLTGPQFSILSGDDGITFDMMTRSDIAACGVISVISNVVPRGVESFVRRLLRGELAEAERLRRALSPLFDVVTVTVNNPRTLPDGSTVTVKDRFRNPLAIKTLMAALGMPAGFCRPPLGRMTWSGVQVVREAAQHSYEIEPGLFEPVERAFGVRIAERLHETRFWRPLARD